MSPSLDPPPTPPRRRRYGPLLAFLTDEEIRSVEIGIVGTILINLLFLLLVPHIFLTPIRSGTKRPQALPQTFSIELAPDTFVHPVPKPILRFVEANPNAPDNIPDKTNNTSFMNQQVAQEKPNPNGHSDMPSMQGRKDFQSNQIVTGSLSKPQDTAVTAPVQTKPPSPEEARRQQIPLAGVEKQTGDDLDAFGNNVGKVSDQANPILDKVDGIKDAPLVDGATSMEPRIDPRHPQPRPTLEQHVRPAIFSENVIGTSNVGITALDARWSNYADYLHKMCETVQIEWDNIIVGPKAGAMVSVTFRMNSKGEIEQIVKHDDGGTGAGDALTRSCISAISLPSPYGPWTDDMIAVLGNEQEMTFTFFVQ